MVSLSHNLLECYHKQWSLQVTPPNCTLRSSLHFAFTERYPSRFDFVKTSLPWENDADSVVLTGIPIHCSLLNPFMEVYAMQKALPDQMMNLIIKKLDERNMGNSFYNALCITQSIQQSNTEL